MTGVIQGKQTNIKKKEHMKIYNNENENIMKMRIYWML